MTRFKQVSTSNEQVTHQDEQVTRSDKEVTRSDKEVTRSDKEFTRSDEETRLTKDTAVVVTGRLSRGGLNVYRSPAVLTGRSENGAHGCE